MSDLSAGQVSIQATAPEEHNSEAYTTLMHARFQWNTLERHQMLDAIRGLQRATELDGSLVSAHHHLMHGYLFLSTFGYMRPDSAAELALKEADRVFALEPGNTSVYHALGWIHFHHHRNLAAATASFARVEYAPFKPWIAHYRARFALGRGRFTEAIDLLRAAVAIDTYSPWPHSRLAWALHLSGDGAAALKQAHHALGLFPHHPMVLAIGSNILSAWGDPGSELAVRATALAKQLTQAAPYLDLGYSALAYAYARQGQAREARGLLERQQWNSRERHVLRTLDVPALVELGDFDAALQELSTAEKLHCPWFFELLADPRLQPLHNHPEFLKLNSISQRMESASESVA